MKSPIIRLLFVSLAVTAVACADRESTGPTTQGIDLATAFLLDTGSDTTTPPDTVSPPDTVVPPDSGKGKEPKPPKPPKPPKCDTLADTLCR